MGSFLACYHSPRRSKRKESIVDIDQKVPRCSATDDMIKFIDFGGKQIKLFDHISPSYSIRLQDSQSFPDRQPSRISLGYTEHLRRMGSQSPSEILPTLFLGSKDDSMNEARLKELKVTHILSVTCGKQHEVNGCKLKAYPMSDKGTSNLDKVMKSTFGFIEESQQNGKKLLVHCLLGQNRSPTLVIAWLMTEFHWTLHEAYIFVKEKRNVTQPTKRYIDQLREYDKRLHGVYSVLPDFLNLKMVDGKPHLLHENWSTEQSREYIKKQVRVSKSLQLQNAVSHRKQYLHENPLSQQSRKYIQKQTTERPRISESRLQAMNLKRGFTV